MTTRVHIFQVVTLCIKYNSIHYCATEVIAYADLTEECLFLGKIYIYKHLHYTIQSYYYITDTLCI